MYRSQHKVVALSDCTCTSNDAQNLLAHGKRNRAQSNAWRKKKYRQMKHGCNVDHCTGGEFVLLPVLCWSADHYVQRCGFKMESFPLRNGRGGGGKGCLGPCVQHVKNSLRAAQKKNSDRLKNANQLKLEIDNIFL